MPLALEPGEIFPVVLKADAAKLADRRPTFYVRHLSVREYRKIDAVLGSLDNAPSGSEAVAQVLEAIRPHLAGWRHLMTPDGATIPFDPADLDAVLTLAEAFELAYAILAGGRVKADEKKASPSPSPSGTASSAPDAGPTSTAAEPAPVP